MPRQWKRGLAIALCMALCSCGSPVEQLPEDDLMESGEMAVGPQEPAPTEAGPQEQEEAFVPGLSPEIAQALEETNIGYLGVFGQGYFVYRDKSSGRYGYIDMRGEVYLEPIFTEVTPFGDDMAVVKTGGGYGVLGIDGSYLLGPDLPYQELRPFSDGLAAFMQDDRWGYIDLEGNQVIEPRYWGAMDFSEGLAVVGYDHPYGGLWHMGEVIDRDGNTVFKLQDVSDDGDFQYHEGIIYVQHHFPDNSFYRWGTYYDRTGNKILPRTVGRAPSFYNGVAFVSRLYERTDSGGRGGQGSYDIMFPDGSFLYQQEEALPGIISDHGYLTDGWLPLPDAENKVEYFREGECYPWKVVMPHTYINLQLEDLGIVNYAPHSYYFSEGLVYVVDEQGKQGYMDTRGDLVINLAEVEQQLGGALLTERYGLSFANGYASVYTAGKCGLIDQSGSLVLVLEDEEAEIYAVFADGDDVAVLVKNTMLNQNRQVVFTCFRMMGLDGSLRFASAEAYETSQNNIYYVPNPYQPYYAENNWR